MARIHIMRPVALQGVARTTYCGLKDTSPVLRAGWFHPDAGPFAARATCQRCISGWEAQHDKRGVLAREG